MRRVRIIPVLLLGSGGLYKTTRFTKPAYIGDPVNTVRIFNEKEVDELVLVDYTASVKRSGPDFETIAGIASEAFMPMAYGGGIRTLEDAQRVFDSGFEKIILNSVLFEDGGLIQKIAGIYGSQAVVGCIDVKKNMFGHYKAIALSGSRKTGWDPLRWAKQLEEYGAGEILLNNIDRDGTWSGYDVNLIHEVAAGTSLPLIACGGAGSLQHFEEAVAAGASAVAAGSLFVYQKKGMGVLVNYPLGYRLPSLR